jgi:preprotein translocase subunit YajC
MSLFALIAQASTAPVAAAGGGSNALVAQLIQFLPFIAIIIIFYFMLIRPQQKRMKAHQDMIAGIKRGDMVVTSGGLIGKIKKVDENEATVELAPSVEVRVVKHTITEVRNKSDAPANDTRG